MLRAKQQSKEERQQKQRIWLQGILASAMKKNWFCTMTIKMEDGMIKQVVPAQSLFPPD